MYLQMQMQMYMWLLYRLRYVDCVQYLCAYTGTCITWPSTCTCMQAKRLLYNYILYLGVHLYSVRIKNSLCEVAPTVTGTWVHLLMNKCCFISGLRGSNWRHSICFGGRIIILESRVDLENGKSWWALLTGSTTRIMRPLWCTSPPLSTPPSTPPLFFSNPPLLVRKSK